MACTLVPTVGAADANTYATIAQADAYHEAHLYGSEWTDTAETKKCQALQMATRLLDRMFDWHGSVVTDAQALLWPRYDVYGANGLVVDSDALPPELVTATAELARQLLASDRTADSAVEAQGITSMTVGPLKFDFQGAQGRPVPDAVFYLVSHLGTLKQRNGGGSVKLGRA